MALSGVFNPIDALPGALQPIARLLPSTHAFAALRDVLAGEPLTGEIVAGLIGASCSSSPASRSAARMLRTFRRRGFVTRFS